MFATEIWGYDARKQGLKTRPGKGGGDEARSRKAFVGWSENSRGRKEENRTRKVDKKRNDELERECRYFK